MQCEVETALELLYDAGELPLERTVTDLVRPEPATIPEISIEPVELESYDALLENRILEVAS
jgi:hypothetical protein